MSLLLLLLPISFASILCSASLCGGLVPAAEAVAAGGASASIPHHTPHPQKHLFLTSVSALPSCTHPLSLTSLHLQHLCWAVTFWASLSCCIPFFPFAWLGFSEQHPHLPFSSPSSGLRITVQGKAGKLSLLPAKVSVGWAAGLPLSLWRMILWMKTEEMALGELLERLRTVTQSIGR